MRGTVIKRGNLYAVVIDLGVDPATGRRARKWHSGYRTLRATERDRTRLLRDVDTGTYVEPDKFTLADFLQREWLPAMKSTVRPGTWSNYIRSQVVGSALGGTLLQKLTAGAVNAFYGDLLAGGRRDGKGGLSAKTVRNIHGLLHKAIGDAARWGRTQRNIIDLVDPPRAARHEMSVWTAEQMQTFLAEARSDRIYAAWRLLAATGMRRGEVLGLRWVDVDVDLSRGTVAVRQTLSVVDHQPRFAEPKTQKGRRAIAIDPATVAILRQHRKTQREERMLIGPGWVDAGLVFTTPEGTLIHPQCLSQWFDQHARRAGLPRIRLHDLRHSHATVSLAAGIHSKVVSERLGHATVAITLDTYSHVTKTMQADAAAKVGALLGD